MISIRTASAFAAIAVLTACGAKPTFVGTWNVGGAEVSWPGSTAVITFSKPNKLEQVLSGPIEAPGVKALLTIRLHGTYKFEEGRLILHSDSFDHEVTGISPEMKAKFDVAFEQQGKRLLDGTNSNSGGEVKWINPDKFEFKEASTVATFTRKK